MKLKILSILSLILMMALSGCNLSLLRPTPTPTSTPLPTPTTIPSPTLAIASPTFTNTVPVILPTTTPSLSAIPYPTATRTPTTASPVIVPGVPSGPYAVILISPGDVLNLRSGPGVLYPVTSSFAATATDVMRSGPSSTVGGALWVEVNKPGGGTGWVNSNFLTEYVAPATFCATGSVTTLLTSLDTALTTNNGVLLSSLVSPVHGMSVYLWRYGNHVVFMPNDARWVFDSTYVHDWGEAPGSGLETNGSFHISVLPYLQEVFNAPYTLTCNSLGTAPSYGGQPWPVLYTNVNYYTVFKTGTPGIDLDFRFFLVGVEFVGGQPKVFALIHFAWEP
jgi:hypothetical protein